MHSAANGMHICVCSLAELSVLAYTPFRQILTDFGDFLLQSYVLFKLSMNLIVLLFYFYAMCNRWRKMCFTDRKQLRQNCRFRNILDVPAVAVIVSGSVSTAQNKTNMIKIHALGSKWHAYDQYVYVVSRTCIHTISPNLNRFW